jgi:hypothetical protein
MLTKKEALKVVAAWKNKGLPLDKGVVHFRRDMAVLVIEAWLKAKGFSRRAEGVWYLEPANRSLFALAAESGWTRPSDSAGGTGVDLFGPGFELSPMSEGVRVQLLERTFHVEWRYPAEHPYRALCHANSWGGWVRPLEGESLREFAAALLVEAHQKAEALPELVRDVQRYEAHCDAERTRTQRKKSLPSYGPSASHLRYIFVVNEVALRVVAGVLPAARADDAAQFLFTLGWSDKVRYWMGDMYLPAEAAPWPPHEAGAGYFWYEDQHGACCPRHDAAWKIEVFTPTGEDGGPACPEDQAAWRISAITVLADVPVLMGELRRRAAKTEGPDKVTGAATGRGNDEVWLAEGREIWKRLLKRYTG